MSITFDPKKNAINIAKHGISLARAEDMNMETAVIVTDDASITAKSATLRSAILTARLTASFSRLGATKCAPSAFAGRTERRLNAMTSKPKFDPALHDDNPEWTKEMFERARPAKDVLPESILSQFKNKGGRPRIERPKEAIKLRIDADVVEAFRKTGPGWQTRINLMLRSALSDGKIKKVHLAKRMGKISVVGSSPKRKRA